MQVYIKSPERLLKLISRKLEEYINLMLSEITL
jgi:hypothetical protein